MNNVTTIGIDIAKNVFHAVWADSQGKQIKKMKLTRKTMATAFSNIPPCELAMEACAGSHHWARMLTAQGHQVKLIPPQYVKPFVKGNKNDYNDAQGIVEASVRPSMRFVSIKTPQQQDIQAIHRIRDELIKRRTAQSNQIRGLLGEYGVVMPKGLGVLRRRLPEILEDGENGLSDLFRELLSACYREVVHLDGRIRQLDRQLNQQVYSNEACQRLQTLPGFGPVVSSVFYTHVGDGQSYDRGRDVSASVGLVPKQHSSADKSVLLGISKRGNRRLRYLLVHGARSVVKQAHKKHDPLSRWIVRIQQRRGYNKAVVAYANKMARMGWAVLHTNTVVQAH
jgi:transposase